MSVANGLNSSVSGSGHVSGFGSLTLDRSSGESVKVYDPTGNCIGEFTVNSNSRVKVISRFDKRYKILRGEIPEVQRAG